jgi:hypothetical protein
VCVDPAHRAVRHQRPPAVAVNVTGMLRRTACRNYALSQHLDRERVPTL